MGCRDRESNRQALSYHDGKWWASWGPALKFEGPSSEIVIQGVEHYSGNIDEWEITEQEPGAWVATRRQPELAGT